MGALALCTLIMAICSMFIAPAVVIALGPALWWAWLAAGACFAGWLGFWTWLTGWLIDNGY